MHQHPNPPSDRGARAATGARRAPRQGLPRALLRLILLGITALICGAACADPRLPTLFQVHNHLRQPLYDFRLQLGEDDWLPVGELAPGAHVFTAEVPRDLPFGVFEFRFAHQRASGDYALGAYRISPDGTVRIELEPAPAAVQAFGASSASGTFRFTPPATPPAAWRAGFAPEGAEQSFPLIDVAPQRTGFTTGMWCADGSIGAGVLLCWTPFMHYYAPVLGIGFGFSWGALVSALPAWRVLQLFPIQATHLGLLTVGGIEFSTVPGDEQTPGLHVASFLGIGLSASLEHAALGGFTLPGRDAAPPDGSYAATCQDLVHDSAHALLSARCLDERGVLRPSSLDLDTCHGSGVMNDHGRLACEHPRGSYERSCAPLRYRDGLLQAACATVDGQGPRASELHHARDCEPESGVSNVDGALRCDAQRFPPGPYRRACSNLRFEAGVLRADCGAGPDTRTTGAVLDYARLCREDTEVGYAPRYAARGELFCRQPR